jgi:hypothetical protein
VVRSGRGVQIIAREIRIGGSSRMAKLKGTVWLVCLAIYFGCFGMAKADEDVGVRLVAETKLLFRTVLADEPPPERCELEPMCQTYSIPESVAREHFGLTLHAELYTTAPFSAGSLRDILNIGDDREPVCSADRAKAIEGERLRQYASSADTRIPIIRRTEYTFPVFSDDYESAALVVYHSGQGWIRTHDGVKSLRMEAIGYVAVYKKIEGTWRRVATIELFVT